MILTLTQGLLNAGSKSMSVNGATTPVTFSYSPGGGITAGVTGITCLLKHDGTTSFSNFGAISALTNGILLQATVSGKTTTLTTIKDNADLCTRFHFNQFGNGAVLSILSVVTPEGFGNSNNVFIGYMEFHTPMLLVDTDSVSAVVQDNLTSVQILQMAVKVMIDG